MLTNNKYLLKNKKGHLVYGWIAKIEITDSYENWNFGFSKKYPLIKLSNCGLLEYNEHKHLTDAKGKIEVAKYANVEQKPHLFLVNDFLKHCNGNRTIDRWRIENGVETPVTELCSFAEKLERYLQVLIKIPDITILKHDREIIGPMTKLHIFDYNNSNYVFSNDLLGDTTEEDTLIPFISYEIFEICRLIHLKKHLNWRFMQCDLCGKYFIKKAKLRLKKVHCPECPMPSQAPIELLSDEEALKRREAGRIRVQKHREKKELASKIQSDAFINSLLK